ncbi:DNA polymerase sliding clamp [Haloarchaeobius amylolyticus]|uniref:DNA polymerase sliding clamp n=1 Tax=Haloarchaeobius amylolyticus TaxID=1198296 RepID=UPI00226E347D|nr:DNA polymerase sliding clamp [Haloarchaeobius amylolyticus]
MQETAQVARFEAIVDATVLDAKLQLVDAVADEALFQLREDGLFVRVIDPAEVAMVETDLPASAFEHYESDGGVLGFDVATLAEAVGLADTDDPLLSLELDAEARKLTVEGADFSYAIAPLHPDSVRQVPDVPTADLPNELTIAAADLQRAVGACDRLANTVHVTVDPDAETVSFRAEADVDDLAFTYDQDRLSSLDATAATETILSLDYTNRIVSEMAGEVTLHLGEEKPAFFEYERDGIAVKNVIAPRFVRG